MRLPNQTLGVVRGKTSGRYQSMANQSYTSTAQGIVAQMRAGGGFSLHWPSWCEVKCEAVAAACFAEIDCLKDCDSDNVSLYRM